MPLILDPGLAPPAPSGKREGADALAVPAPPWAPSTIDWQGEARTASRNIDTPSRYFSERALNARRRGPSIDFTSVPTTGRTGLPESYINSYGEGEIRISEDCVARENQALADLDYIDVMPAIINCQPPASTFELPTQIINRGPKAPTDSPRPPPTEDR